MLSVHCGAKDRKRRQRLYTKTRVCVSNLLSAETKSSQRGLMILPPYMSYTVRTNTAYAIDGKSFHDTWG